MLESGAIVAIIVGVTEVIKGAGLPSKFAPLVAVVLGLAASFGIEGFGILAAFNGLIYGLSASGLYSGAKALAR